MGFLDRLLGRDDTQRSGAPPGSGPAGSAGSSDDERALERYRYLVRTAPPDRLEQAHEEAFARLTPEQRRLALQELSRAAPGEQAAGDDPRSLARMATRAEMRQPGTVERAFGRAGGGLGGMGVPLLGSFATAFAGTLAAQALFSELSEGDGGDGGDGDGQGGGDTPDAGAGDQGGGDFGSGDFGGGDAGF